MNEYFLLLLVSSIWCCGLSVITEKGKVLYFLRYLAAQLPEWMYYPILGCIPCMASIHTGLVYLFLISVFGFEFNIWIYVFAAISGAFTNTVMWMIYRVLHGAYLFYEEISQESGEQK